jgi:hypothetical protein
VRGGRQCLSWTRRESHRLLPDLRSPPVPRKWGSTASWRPSLGWLVASALGIPAGRWTSAAERRGSRLKDGSVTRQNPRIFNAQCFDAHGSLPIRAVCLRQGTERQAAATRDAVDHSRVLITRADDICPAINTMRPGAIARLLLGSASRRRPLTIRR